MPDEQLCHSLLTHLDDTAFCAYDLLVLSEELVADYKELVVALSERFAPLLDSRNGGGASVRECWRLMSPWMHLQTP